MPGFNNSLNKSANQGGYILDAVKHRYQLWQYERQMDLTVNSVNVLVE